MTEEYKIQCDFFKHVHDMSSIDKRYRYIFHIPNEGKRSLKSALTLKRMGLKNGVPDIFVSVPCGQYHGMYIEFKSAKGKLTTDQQEFLSDALAKCYYTIVS